MKLRKLKAAGFKSFADPIEFIFDDGITCVVGPNGCGKSNVVDAVKWVLGEQSAKSLRGSEMMDVIFNGSSARRASGMAEVTLEFDNESGGLHPTAPAASDKRPHLVSITRRLYRSGESEYLINNQAARLKDIREMFMDTGIGASAYSIIEQGKVAEMLQTNPVERRVIFEEAAGISKYKARKKEALRKLERAEQNLLRLNDILAEVQKQLRSVKVQAGKARNYQTYTERLRELRGLFSLAQYHQMCGRRQDLQGELGQIQDHFTALTSRAGQLEANQSSTETELADLERQQRQVEGENASISGQITATEERIDMLNARCKEIAEQIVQAERSQGELAERIEGAEEELERLDGELKTVELRIRQHAEQVEAMLDEQQSGQHELTRLQGAVDDEKAAAIEAVRRVGQLHNQESSSRVRAESLGAQKQRLAERGRQIAERVAEIDRERSDAQVALDEVVERIGQTEQQLERARAAGQVASAEQQRLVDAIGQAKEQRSALSSRWSTLEEMQRRGEGLGEGVRKALAAREEGRLGFVRGVLAEFVHARFEHAAVVESALADLEQSLLVDDSEALLAGRAELADAVGEAGVKLICLDRAEPYCQNTPAEALEPSCTRLMDLVTVDPSVAPAMWRLLGTTLVVDDLAAADRLSRRVPGRRIAARDGAMILPDGSVRLGRGAGGGLIARRSEMEELTRRIGELDEQIQDLTAQRDRAQAERSRLDEQQQQLRNAVYEANTRRVNGESAIRRLEEELHRLQQEQPAVARDIASIDAEIDDAVKAQREAAEMAQRLEADADERQTRIDALNGQLGELKQRQDHITAELTERRVAHAQALEQRTRVTETMVGLRTSIERMNRERQTAGDNLASAQQRRQSSEEAIAAGRADINRLFARKTELDQAIADLQQSRQGLLERIEEIRGALAEQRRAAEKAQQEIASLRVKVGEEDVRIENLIQRAGEELNVDLIEQYRSYEHDSERDWQAVDDEIKDLHGKIERLGNVNLDAITQQDELTERETFLSNQLGDIEASKKQLADLIQKINKLSTERFQETFDTVREHFRTIFRKLFGGGKADILLTDPDDILESGIEIIARPPGKELRSMTLLSGGEKTMTTVALVFSIFRSKPSPFCLLDEVDAALDEANNERFNTILEEFLDLSQFIVITHSKRTMAIANAMYGVTMQEAGISTRVSVRFEEAARMVDEEPEGKTQGTYVPFSRTACETEDSVEAGVSRDDACSEAVNA